MAEEQLGNQTNNLTAEVEKMLRLEDAGSLAGSMGLMLKGLGVCIGAGFVVATALLILRSLLFDITFIGWRGFFWLYLLGISGLIYWYEQKSRQNYQTGAIGAASSVAKTASESPVENGRIMAILLWAPRAVVDGFRGFRGMRTREENATFARAAILVVNLAGSQGGIDIKRLVHPPEDMQIFGLAVDLLDTHGWIGKATDGKSLWLNSTFREKLRALTPHS